LVLNDRSEEWARLDTAFSMVGVPDPRCVRDLVVHICDKHIGVHWRVVDEPEAPHAATETDSKAQEIESFVDRSVFVAHTECARPSTEHAARGDSSRRAFAEGCEDRLLDRFSMCVRLRAEVIPLLRCVGMLGPCRKLKLVHNASFRVFVPLEPGALRMRLAGSCGTFRASAVPDGFEDQLTREPYDAKSWISFELPAEHEFDNSGAGAVGRAGFPLDREAVCGLNEVLFERLGIAPVVH
jgi:hypothetical protein